MITELYSSIFEELQSTSEPPTLPFFIRTPNARAGAGSHQDCWMPSPGQCSHSSLEQFRFIGQMIGVSIRGKVQLKLNLPPLFWKVLTGQKLTIGDMEAVDTGFPHLVGKMREQARVMTAAAAAAAGDSASSSVVGGIEADEFGSMFGLDSFTCLLSDGKTVFELVSDGASRPVTLANFEEWIQLATHARLHETALQMGALRSGLASIVPLHLLCFFSWSELERLVCGLADFPVSLLQSVTVYEGSLSDSTPHIRFFWEVLEEMTPAQKAAFMRFVFARERLPARPQELGIKFKLQEPNHAATKDPDQHFPSSHTCFFSLSLPAYKTKAKLAEKLLYACSATGTMDGDLVLKNSELYDYSADDISQWTHTQQQRDVAV